MYVEVKQLPECIRKALQEVNYNRKDICVNVQETMDLRPSSGDGTRGFTCVINLETCAFKTAWGSWGGANPFNRTIDDFDAPVPIYENMVYLQGHSGETTYGSLYMSPLNVAGLIEASTVNEREARILCIYKSLKPAYRRSYLQNMEATDAEVNSLIERGFLSKNKVGIQITTLGKNNAGKDY